MRDQYGRQAFKIVRRTLPYTRFWGIEAYAPRDADVQCLYMNVLLDHEHPYFLRIMMRAQFVLEWHVTSRYFPIKSRAHAYSDKQGVFLKPRGDVVGSWYPLTAIHAVFRKVQYDEVAIEAPSDHEQI